MIGHKAQIEENKKTMQDNVNLINHLNNIANNKLPSSNFVSPSITQSTYRPATFNKTYEPPANLIKSSLTPSLAPSQSEERFPEIKKYTGGSEFRIPLKTETSGNLSQERDPE